MHYLSIRNGGVGLGGDCVQKEARADEWCGVLHSTFYILGERERIMHVCAAPVSQPPECPPVSPQCPYL